MFQNMTNLKKYPVIGQRLADVRLALHPELSIQDFTVFLGVKYTQYLNWESGLNRPTPDQAEVLCDKLGLSMDFIYRGKEAQLAQKTLKALISRSRDSAQSTSTESPDDSAA